jgi:hypothetical protein
MKQMQISMAMPFVQPFQRSSSPFVEHSTTFKLKVCRGKIGRRYTEFFLINESFSIFPANRGAQPLPEDF